VLFVAVKAPDLLAALSRIPPPMVAGAAVVPLLNGVDHVSPLRAVLPASRVVPMTVAVEATRVTPGVVEHRSNFADFAACAGADAGPIDVLRSADLAVDTSSPDELSLLWRKLAFLAPFALLTTSQRVPLGEARAARPDLLDALVDEAAGTGQAAGARLDADAIRSRLHGLPGTMRSSMLNDAEGGAALELDAIAGPIMRRHPGGAPATRAVVAEILAAESRA